MFSNASRPVSVRHSTTGRFESTARISPVFTASFVIVCKSVAIPRAANTRINAVVQPLPMIIKKKKQDSVLRSKMLEIKKSIC